MKETHGSSGQCVSFSLIDVGSGFTAYVNFIFFLSFRSSCTVPHLSSRGISKIFRQCLYRSNHAFEFLNLNAGEGTPLRNLAQGIITNSRNAVQVQPELEGLRERLQQYLFSGMYDGVEKLPASLPSDVQARAAALAAMALVGTISTLPGGYLVSSPSWGCHTGPGALQVVRACSCFYGQERYDFVSFFPAPEAHHKVLCSIAAVV